MPNWCSNYIEFKGDRVNEIKEMLRSGAEFNERMGQGWIPDFVQGEDWRYLFYISTVELTKDGTLLCVCETKWSPPTGLMVEFCKHFGVSVEVRYAESGCGLYGLFVYENNAPLDIYLDVEDTDKVTYDEDTDSYIYNGKSFESDFEIYEGLLDEKIKQYHLAKNDARLSNSC